MVLKGERFDFLDYKILASIKQHKGLGTIELSKTVGLAPKNLINRMNKYITAKWVSKSSVSAEPKGRKRVYELTSQGETTLKFYKSLEHFFKSQQGNDLKGAKSDKKH